MSSLARMGFTCWAAWPRCATCCCTHLSGPNRFCSTSGASDREPRLPRCIGTSSPCCGSDCSSGFCCGLEGRLNRQKHAPGVAPRRVISLYAARFDEPELFIEPDRTFILHSSHQPPCLPTPQPEFGKDFAKHPFPDAAAAVVGMHGNRSEFRVSRSHARYDVARDPAAGHRDQEQVRSFAEVREE